MSWFTSLINFFKNLFSDNEPIMEEVPPTSSIDALVASLISGVRTETVTEVAPPVTSDVVVPQPSKTPKAKPSTETAVDEEQAIIEKLCKDYDLNARMVRSIAKVESSGMGFREYKGLGYFPVLRFEPHWFNKYEKKNPMPFTDNGKGFSSIASETNHVAYKKAYAINPDAAIKATSFGKFQIMGFHFSKLGYNSPVQFLEAMKTLTGQYDAFLKFIMSKPALHNTLRKDIPNTSDFKSFAKGYNGSSNADVYSKKIEKAYNSFA